jgi:hypothetical protein
MLDFCKLSVVTKDLNLQNKAVNCMRYWTVIVMVFLNI